MEEIYTWAHSYLNWLLKDLVDIDIQLNYKYEEIVEEIKIMLRAINYILDNSIVLDNVRDVYKMVEKYENSPPYSKDIPSEIKLFFDIVYALDVDGLIKLYDILRTSKIYNDFVPSIIEYLLSTVDIRIESSKNNIEFDKGIMYGFQLLKIIQNHKYIYDIVHLLGDLTMEEIHYVSEVVEYLNETDTLRDLLPDVARFSITECQIKMDFPYEIIYKIKEWDRELELVKIVMEIIHTYQSKGYIDYDRAWYGLVNYSNTILFKEAFIYAINLLPKAFTMWIAGKDYRYLVGEYAIV
jgi:hypothetical protein